MPARRLSGAAGVVTAVLFVIGLVTVKLPGGPDNDQEVVSWFNDSGHRVNQYVGGYLWVVAALVLLWFAIGVANRLRDQGAGEDTVVLARIGGGVAAAMLLAAATCLLSMVVSITLQDGGKSSQQVATMGWIAVTLALVAFPFALATLMIAVARAAGTPTWLMVLSWLGVVAMLAAIAFVPLFIGVIWLAATGVYLLRGDPVAVTA